MDGNHSKDSPLLEKLSSVSGGPGVYLMKDADGNVIYVGKAKNLKKRLGSYFKPPRLQDSKTAALVKKISVFETIVTHTEKEALILESNLIKRHRPRYNVILKDDKRYASLKLEIRNPYPFLSVARKIEKDGALYFGPFSSGLAVRQTLKLIHKTFKLRKCQTKELKKRARPCLLFQMDACLAPCCRNVSSDEYQEIVNEVVLFLKGRTPELIEKVRSQMAAAARVQEFEKAAALRDRLFALQETLEKQVSVTHDFADRDVLAVAEGDETSLVTQMIVRNGFLLGVRHFAFSGTMVSGGDLLETFIRQHYEATPFVPKEILIAEPIETALHLSELLGEIKGQKVRIIRPQRGEKLRLTEMAIQNAINHLRELVDAQAGNADMLDRLAVVLNIRAARRIECVDNSNIGGTEMVSGLVVYEDARPKKSDYRRYRIRTATGPDDYAAMSEVLGRRFGKDDAAYPDLLMVDGGKGQIGMAVAVARELGIEGRFQIIGIAKKDEARGETRDKIYQPGRSNPVNFRGQEDLLLFLQRIRDEAHRFAVSYHRKRRGKAALQSVLDHIPGIGIRRKRTLLQHFGSIKKIRAASVDELNALPGMNRKSAEAVHQALAS